MESKEKKELCMHLFDSTTGYIILINLFNVKYGRQHKLNYNSMPSAFSLAKKLNLLVRHRNCGSGGYAPSDKVGAGGGGGGGGHPDPEVRPVVSKKLFFGPSSFIFV